MVQHWVEEVHLLVVMDACKSKQMVVVVVED